MKSVDKLCGKKWKVKFQNWCRNIYLNLFLLTRFLYIYIERDLFLLLKSRFFINVVFCMSVIQNIE